MIKIKFVRVIDENGLFISDDFVDELTEFTVETQVVDSFYLPKWDFEKEEWVEGLTEEEIQEIKDKAAKEKELTAEEEIKMLKSRLTESENMSVFLMDMIIGGM